LDKTRRLSENSGDQVRFEPDLEVAVLSDSRGLELSVVIPVFNEADNLVPLYERLLLVLTGLRLRWELLFVDDGSTDGSYDALRGICDRDARCSVIRFRRNFGQTAALAAGFDAAGGAIIVTLDGDGQNDPNDIPRLVAKIVEGYDLVNGWREKRQDPFLNRRLPSQAANAVISLITGVRLHDFGCSLKAIRREFAKELKLYGEMHRFIPAIAMQLGARIVEIPVAHHPRRAGKSKYGIGRTFRVVLDLLTVKFLSEYSTRPSHFFGLIGLLAVVGGSSVTAVLVFERAVFKRDLANRPLLLLAIFVTLVGIQLLTMGLMGEMLSRIYHEGQRKPIYLVREIYRAKEKE